MKLSVLYEYFQAVPGPYLDPKSKAKTKKDYSMLVQPSDRGKFISWGHKKKKKGRSRKKA